MICMGLLPDTENCGCACAGNAGNVLPATGGRRSWHTRHIVIYHGTCVTHVPWCMPGSLTRGFPALESVARKNVPGIPGACATRNAAYLVRGPWSDRLDQVRHRSYVHAERSLLTKIFNNPYHIIIDIKQCVLNHLCCISIVNIHSRNVF